MNNGKVVHIAALVAIASLSSGLNASQCASSNITSAGVLLNAPIDFCFPHLGNVGSCNLQTHTNGWTRENIDRWEFEPCDNFNNGVASVVVNGQTNTWTVLAPDRPLFRFGRYYCGFVREDRPDKTHAIYAGLFFGGVMVGAEHMREDFDWRTHTWHELDNIPDGIRQIGGGEWETGFIVWPKSLDNPIDINQMILRHDQSYMLSTERRRWLRTATEKDIHDEWNKVQKIIDSIDEIPGETNSDLAHRVSAIYNLKNQFWQMMLQWKIFQAKSTGEKYNALRAKSVITQIQEKCDKARRGVRGSHVGPDWGECLYVDLLNAWVLEGEDASCWNKVANMKGIIDGHALEFQFGLATVDLSESKDESGYCEEEPLKLFKVQNDFYSANGYVYAKVIGERPGYCYMPCSYEPPTYVVRVDTSGRMVNWYRYPKRAKTLKEFLGSNPK